MKNLFLLLFSFLFTQICSAQGQFNNWYCGYGTGINFNTSPPSSISVNPMNTDDNSATISDASGNVLFYSNGISVYDRNGNIMPNGSGLIGDPSAGQTSTIVQMPGSDSLYYLFIMDKQAGSNGCSYNVIDMSLNGGLGDIIPGKKSITILAPATEKIEPIRHANGIDAWILIHEWNSDAFRAYLLTDSGLSASPVITHIGTVNTGGYSPGYNASGQLTVNSTNDKVAAAIYSDGNIQLFDFDNSTGILSNSVLIPLYRAWGLEFSPNGQFLYASGWTQSALYQFDITTYTDTAIIASQVNIGTATNEGYLRKGPDGKIYVAEYQTNYIGAISNPDVMGIGCNFNETAISTGTHQSSAGLVDKILVNGSSLTGISTINANTTISCYPSPSSGRFTIDMLGLNAKDKLVNIYDQLGQIVYHTVISQNKLEINNTLSQGLYTVSVTQGSIQKYGRVVIE